jgi:DNA-binding transcriptional ArsR family regulator
LRGRLERYFRRGESPRVINIDLEPDALSRVRLSASSMWEVMSSLRLLLHDPGHRLHTRWLAWASARLDAELVDLLSGLMPTRTRWPDFLTPTPAVGLRSFRKDLDAVATTDPDVVRREIDLCWDGSPSGSIRTVMAKPDAGLAALVTALDRYWQQALAPVWSRVRSVLAADLAFRADELAAGGLQTLLNELHPKVSFDGETVSIDKSEHTISRTAGRAGLVLVPCAFAWPEVFSVVCEPYPVTVSYAPRGAGTLWQPPQPVKNSPASRLLGNSRAMILGLLDVPLTNTQLAQLARLSMPAVSQHLGVLRQSGLVTSRRSGRTQWNTRTPLGCALIDRGQEQ